MAILRGFIASGSLADEVDVQEAVLQRRARHLDVVGELEAALEGAGGDAAIEHFTALLALLFVPLALHHEHVFLRLDVDVALAEACDGHGDAVGVLVAPLDVVGRIGLRRFAVPPGRIEQAEQTVETDGRTIERA